MIGRFHRQFLAVVSNIVTPTDATNWAVVTTPTNDYVLVQATLSITNDWFLTNATLPAEAGAAIQWSGGELVLGNPLQYRVSKAVSSNITVTASLGSSSQSLNVWVIWSTISCHNGVITQSLDFNSLPESVSENSFFVVAAAILAASDVASSRVFGRKQVAGCRLHWQAGSPPPRFQTRSKAVSWLPKCFLKDVTMLV